MTDPLVLLPGMMCDARLFGPQIDALHAQTAVTVGDISGADNMAALASSVLAEAPPQFALAGLSMGGIVAMEVLRQAPGRVTRLALMDTNPFAETPEVQSRRGPQIERALAGRLLDVMRDEMKPNYLAESAKKREILDLCMDMALALGPEVFVRQSMALRDRPDQEESLRRATVPALILCGRHDRLCPVSRHEAMQDMMPQARLTVIEAAGHLPTLEAPEITTQALKTWLTEKV